MNKLVLTKSLLYKFFYKVFELFVKSLPNWQLLNIIQSLPFIFNAIFSVVFVTKTNETLVSKVGATPNSFIWSATFYFTIV